MSEMSQENSEESLEENNHDIGMGFFLGYYSIRNEWNLWASKNMLIAKEAIPLMNGLDPRSWDEYGKKEKRLPYEMAQSIYRSLKMAKKERISVCTPLEWLEWGRKHDLDKPILKSKDWLNAPDVCMFKLFEIAVNSISVKSINAQSTEKQEEDSWKEIALSKADEIYRKRKTMGCDPSKDTIANTIAKEFEEEGIKTEKGKRLNAGNILRNALDKWNRPKK